MAKEFTLFSNQAVETLTKMPKVLEARQAEKLSEGVRNILEFINSQENNLTSSRNFSSN